MPRDIDTELLGGPGLPHTPSLHPLLRSKAKGQSGLWEELRTVAGCLLSKTATIHPQMTFPSSPGPLKQHPMGLGLPLKSCPTATRMMFQRCEFGLVPLPQWATQCPRDLAQSHYCHSDILPEDHVDTWALPSLKHPPTESPGQLSIPSLLTPGLP